MTDKTKESGAGSEGEDYLAHEELNWLYNVSEAEERAHLQARIDKMPKEIKEVAEKYKFFESTAEIEAYYNQAGRDNFSYDRERILENMVFLAMLDKYVGESGYQMAEDDIYVLDFGSAQMNYLLAYKAFFDRYGKDADESKRKLIIVAWEEGDNETRNPLGWEGGRLIRQGGWLSSEEQVTSLLQKRKINSFSVITMFGSGPGGIFMKPETINEAYRKSISCLVPSLSPEVIVMITTSGGGPKKEDFLAYLQEMGLEIKLDKENEYAGVLG